MKASRFLVAVSALLLPAVQSSASPRLAAPASSVNRATAVVERAAALRTMTTAPSANSGKCADEDDGAPVMRTLQLDESDGDDDAPASIDYSAQVC